MIEKHLNNYIGTISLSIHSSWKNVFFILAKWVSQCSKTSWFVGSFIRFSKSSCWLRMDKRICSVDEFTVCAVGLGCWGANWLYNVVSTGKVSLNSSITLSNSVEQSFTTYCKTWCNLLQFFAEWNAKHDARRDIAVLKSPTAVLISNIINTCWNYLRCFGTRSIIFSALSTANLQSLACTSAVVNIPSDKSL